MHFFLHPGVGYDKFAIIEDVVTDKAVEKFCESLCERLTNIIRQGIDFGQRLGKAVGDSHIFATKLLEQLHVVISGDANSAPVLHHVPNDSHGIENSWPTIPKVADENRFATLRMLVDRTSPDRITIVVGH